MKNTIEINLQRAEAMIPCLENRISGLTFKGEEAFRERDELVSLLADIRAALSNRAVSVEPTAEGEARKRLPKGAGDDLVFNLLKTIPEGHGLSPTEIQAKTGLNHATIHRVLNEPNRNKGRFVRVEKLWKLKT